MRRRAPALRRGPRERLQHSIPSQTTVSVAACLRPLRSHRLRRIIGAYTVNRLGTWFGFVALSVAVFDHTHSALAVAALLIWRQALPAFVVPAAGGAGRGFAARAAS